MALAYASRALHKKAQDLFYLIIHSTVSTNTSRNIVRDDSFKTKRNSHGRVARDRGRRQRAGTSTTEKSRDRVRPAMNYNTEPWI